MMMDIDFYNFGLLLSERERSALVAAIRWWQIEAPDQMTYSIATRDGKFRALDNQELSELAERILPDGPT